MNERLIIFTRNPEPNRCKTRLIPSLGPEGAAELHQSMTTHTLDVASRFCTQRPVQLHVEFDAHDGAPFQSSMGNKSMFRRQAEGDLGTRLAWAFRRAFDEGAERVVLIGTDCPGITGRLLESSFGLLEHQDVVLGPASDGGYYLMGLQSHEPALFDAMPWGSSKVLAETLIRAERHRLGTALLPTLDDVDRPEDLAVWERFRVGDKANDQQVSLSVIVPTFGSEPGLEATLQSAAQAVGAEVIVVAAGETTYSTALARKYGCILAQTSPGRGRQLNIGSTAANGETLLFLHADTQLPAGYAKMVEAVLSQAHVAAGAFPLHIDANGAKYRLIERGVGLRSRLLQMPYGDQAMFLRRELFQQLEGFREWPIMEDFEILRRVRNYGRIELVGVPVMTSARRWRRVGAMRTTLINQGIILAYMFGVPADVLATWYRRDGAGDLGTVQGSCE